MEGAWGTQNLNNKPDEYSSSTEREARSIALEKAYVHDVYSQIASHFSDSRYRAWPKVKQFLLELEPGSIVCDVGCGNGKYLDINPSIYKIGIDRCSNLTGAAREKNHEVLISDNLNIPFRDDCFDAVISIAVIHHFATTERRVTALKELARVLRIGGRLMVSVWAMEQRHRRFESQDVLVPWNRPMNSSSDDKTSSIERDLNSTTTTSDDDAATHYHAYTQTSDSDHSFPSCSVGGRKRGRIRHRGRSFDPTCPSSSQSSSDLSSPNESCYTFVRRALQKLAGTRRNRGGRRPWFLQGLDIPVGDDDLGHFGSLEEDAVEALDFRHNLANQQINNFMPIELRQLEATDFADLLQSKNDGKPMLSKPGLLFSNVLYPRRRRTLETTCELQQPTGSIAAQPKSKSLSDLFGLIPYGILWSQRKSTEELLNKEKHIIITGHSGPSDVARSSSSLSERFSSTDEILFPDCVRHKAVQTESVESLDKASRPPSELIGNLNLFTAHPPTHGSISNISTTQDSSLDSIGDKKSRPVLVKQKQSISSPSGGCEENGGENSHDSRLRLSPSPVCWGDMKKSVRDLPQLRRPSVTGNTLQVPMSRGGVPLSPSSSFWKQSSLNEELIFSERLKEKQLLKQNIQKQCSLNEELIYKRRENTRWDQMKEAFLNSPNVKCLQLIKNGISNRFRGSTDSGMHQAGGVNHNHNGDHHHNPLSTGNSNSSSSNSPSPTFLRQQPGAQTSSASSTIRNGIVRMLQNWKQSDNNETSGPVSPLHNASSLGFGARRGSKEGTQRRGLFPPFFLRRNSAGSLTLNKDPMSSSKVLSPPHLKRRPSENELVHEGVGNGNKLTPGVRHIRKLSREEGSDSSKDSSFQSDTSVDSEDSFASVIFIPNKGSGEGGNDAFTFHTETRANSTDSDRSPKSPASRLSPPNHNMPKSPSPLASELLRRRSPDVSPTKVGLYGPSGGEKEVTKFVFDENATKLLSPGPTTFLPPDIVTNNLSDLSSDELSVNITVPELCQSNAQELISAPLLPTPQKKKVEKIEVLRKPASIPQGNKVTRSLVRRSLPKALAVELYNPETEDADTSDTSSSSPNSVSSVVSISKECCKDAKDVTQPGRPLTPPLPKQSPVPEEESKNTEQLSSNCDHTEPASLPRSDSRKSSSVNILDAAAHIVSSFENLVSQSSPKTRKKLSLSKLGSTSEWLSSLPTSEDVLSDIGKGSGGTSTSIQVQQQQKSPPQLLKRSSIERRSAGEKLMLGDVKKYQSKGPDAKWPSSIIGDSPPQSATTSIQPQTSQGPLQNQKTGGEETKLNSCMETPTPQAGELSAKLLEEMEEAASLFDSLENLSDRNGRAQASRNPSIDSSVRMSSTCSCSIRGGESFESWSSAKSSLTNSSSTQHKTSLPSIIPLPSSSHPHPSYRSSTFSSGGGGGGGGGGGCGHSNSPSGRIRYQGMSSKSSSAAGEDTDNSAENSTALTYHRYYHVFREGELDKLIEKYVQNLHIISSYYDHANWCIIAEKVQVWTI